MKKYMIVLALIAMTPAVPEMAYGYGQQQTEYRSARSGTRANTYQKTGSARKTSSQQVTPYYTSKGSAGNSGYYTTTTSVDTYTRSDNDRASYYNNTTKKQTSRTTRSYATQERKFFLAHPFFQPLKGHVGSVTDFAYSQNSFNFDLQDGRVIGLDPNVTDEYGYVLPATVLAVSGKAETSQFLVKEDLSYGLTDTLALVLMAQYDKTKVTMKDWSGGEPEDSKSDSGLNIFGIGLQNRFVDNSDWIVMGEAFFQHQRDTANTLMGAVKAGYKIDRTTVYGVGRLAYTNLINGDTYGAYVEDGSGDWLMLAYNTDVKDLFQAELGLGAFAVLNKYFTLNAEGMFGHYDWHNQFNIKGAIGWQPADMFALNLYASTVLYDSAEGKTKQYINYDVNPDGVASSVVYAIGDYKIKDYKEWKIGVQATLYF